jgi:EAL domain-containing protein (putative c-di-GMP-specific phosphodiesterase class I)/GGDEF domain-containing protein
VHSGFEDPESVELQTRLLQYRAGLFDPLTKLPTLPVVIDRVRQMLDERGNLHVLLVRIEHEQNLERIVGWERYDAVLGSVASHLSGLLEAVTDSANLLCQENVRGDIFLVILADHFEAGRLHDTLLDGIKITNENGEDELVAVRVGQGVIKMRPALRVERTIYNGILDARQDFHRRGEALDQTRLDEVRRILREESIRTLFQPIVRLPWRNIMGFEALSRGPEGSYLETADNLFGFTERAGMLGEVEMLCVERALTNAKQLPEGSILFLNLSMLGLEFIESEEPGLTGRVKETGRSPAECVLEITERTYAESADRLRERVAALRKVGFRIAIDDMGTGYSALHVLAELQPDFIKLDKMLIRNLPDEPIKRNLVSAIMTFANDSQSVVIAEGVETEDEVEVLSELGIELQQGYFFGFPEPVEKIKNTNVLTFKPT